MTDRNAQPEPHLLFTAFEPSGDDHASGVIAELKRRYPGLRISACGGRKMAAAGAEIIEPTGEAAVMGMPGLAKIREHRRINTRIDAWIGEHRPTVLVPVDSPAANFPICEVARKHRMSIVHLVAPQIWAWGSWRIRKMRRLTDMVLCLLPFEEQYFRDRGVPATFIGHPLFDEPLDMGELDASIADWPRGEPKLALMPGSRPAEIERNFPLQLEVFRRLSREHTGLRGMVACVRPEVEDELRRFARQTASPGEDAWPKGLEIATGRTDAVIRWCDLALVVSGTVTLQIARQHKPMVIVYKSSLLMYMLIGRWILRARLLTLPNIIAGRKIVPEMVPHFGGAGPVIQALLELIEHPRVANEQRNALAGLASKYANTHAVRRAADEIARVAGLVEPDVGDDAVADRAAGGAEHDGASNAAANPDRVA